MFELKKNFPPALLFCSVWFSNTFLVQKLEMSKFVKKVIPRIMKKGQHRLGSSGDAREKPRVPAGDEPTGTDQKAPIELNLPSKLVELNNSQVGDSLNLFYC